MKTLAAARLVGFLLLAGCGTDGIGTTPGAAGMDDAALPPDGESSDAAVIPPDGGASVDTSVLPVDGGTTVDVRARTDTTATGTDGGVTALDAPRGADVGIPGGHDAGASLTDTSPRDSRVTVMDTGVTVTDTGAVGMDTGAVGMDTGVRDTGIRDTGMRDAGARDTGVDVGITVTDSGPPGLPGADPVAYTGRFPATLGRVDTQLTTAVEGAPRDVALYIPRVMGPRRPLMLLFHGTNGSGPQMISDSNAQMVADAYGVVIAAPSSNWIGHGDWDHPAEDTYWLTYPNSDPNTNPDLVLVRAIIAEAIRVYDIDQNRVYSVGHSSGAFFSLLVSETLPGRIAAFASSSGGLVRCPTTLSCHFMTSATTCAGLSGSSGWCSCSGVDKPGSLPASGRHPPGWLGHGTNDPLVSVQYTCTLESAMRAQGIPVETHLRVGDGHVMPDNFAPLVWPFLSSHVRM